MKFSLPPLPFKGLKPFLYADRNIFAARDQEILKAQRLILQFRGILIYGASGTGKSSLVYAGLLPQLLESTKFTAEIIRLSEDQNYTFIVSRIKKDDGGFIESIFQPFLRKEEDDRIGISFEDFQSTLKRVDIHTTKSKIPILIFDQFEELITFFEEKENSSEQTLALQKKVIDLLANCYYDHELAVKLMFIFRDDYLPKFGRLFFSIPDLRDNSIYLKNVEIDQLLKIVMRPFDSEDKRNHFMDPFSTTLGEKIVKEFTQRSRKTVNLTEVQIACSQLFATKPDEERNSILDKRGVAGVIEDFYVALLENIPRKNIPIVLGVLSTLVLNERTRNVVHVDGILKMLENHQKESVLETIDVLEKETPLIRRENRMDGKYYEITSEYIIPFINKRKEAREKEAKLKAARWKDNLITAAGLSVFIAVGLGTLYWDISRNTRDALRLVNRAELKKYYSLYKKRSTDLDNRLYRKKDSTLFSGMGDMDSSVELLKQATETAPGILRPEISKKLILAYLEVRRFEEARNSFVREIEQDSTQVIFFYPIVATLDEMYVNEESYEKSIEIGKFKRKVLEIAYAQGIEGDQSYLKLLAKTLFTNQMDTLCYRTLLKINPLDDWTASTLGDYYETGLVEGKADLEKASAIYRSVKGGNELYFKVKLSRVMMAMGKPEDASKIIDEIRTDQNYLLYDLGMNYYQNAVLTQGEEKRQNYLNAIEIFEHIKTQYENNDYFLYYLASSYARTQNFTQAFKTFNYGLKTNPGNPLILNGYAWWLTKDNPNKAKLQAALAMSEKAVSLAQRVEDKANFLDTQAEILIKLEMMAEAQKINQDALRLIGFSDKAQLTDELIMGVNNRKARLDSLLGPQPVQN